MIQIRDFYTKVVGSTFCNGQELIPLLKEGQVLKLISEPDNAFDTNAIAVYVSEQDKLGYIPRETAKMLQEYLIDKYTILATVSQITGNTDVHTFSGCNIQIKIWCLEV